MRAVGLGVVGALALLLLALPATAANNGGPKYTIVYDEEHSKGPYKRPEDGKIVYDITFHVKAATLAVLESEDAPDMILITEDGRPAYRFALQRVQATAFTTVLVLDTSSSMALPRQSPKIAALKKAAAHFVDLMPPRARVTLLPFSSQVTIAEPFTSDKGRIKTRIDRLQAKGGTLLYDAALAGIETLAADNQPGKRFVVVLTDGVDEDPGSRHDLGEVIRRAQEAKVNIYTIGLGSKAELDEAALSEMAEKTGGKYTQASQASELASIYSGLAVELQSTYTVTFPSLDQRMDATLSRIKIVVVDKEGKQVSNAAEGIKARTGLVVPELDYLVYLVLLGMLLGLLFLPSWLKRSSGPPAASAPAVPVPRTPPVARLVPPRR